MVLWPGALGAWPTSSITRTTPKPTSGTALAINERIAAPYWIARTQLDYADLLRDVGKDR